MNNDGSIDINFGSEKAPEKYEKTG